MKVKRIVENQIVQELLRPAQEAVVVYGGRKVGKTVLSQQIIARLHKPTKIFYCGESIVARKLNTQGIEALSRQLADYELVVFDDAERLTDLLQMVKNMVDYLPTKRAIFLCSTTRKIEKNVEEAWTSRVKEYYLTPLARAEIGDESPDIEEFLRYGMLGMVREVGSENEKQAILTELANDYVCIDTLRAVGEKQSEVVRNLLVLLALQIGQEASYTDLAVRLGIDHKTVEKYIDLLIANMVIFRLPTFARKLKSEKRKTRKIYFWDLGVRNALVENFAPLAKRADREELFENWVIGEKFKKNLVDSKNHTFYFWQTHDKKEVKLIEEMGGRLTAYNTGWDVSGETKGQREFSVIYPQAISAKISHDSANEGM